MIQVLVKLSLYRIKYQIISQAHHLVATRYARYNNFLGIPVVVFTAITGTAILPGLQIFLGFSEKTEAHNNAGIRYSIIKR